MAVSSSDNSLPQNIHGKKQKKKNKKHRKAAAAAVEISSLELG